MQMKLHNGRSIQYPSIIYPIFDLQTDDPYNPTNPDVFAFPTGSIVEYSETVSGQTFRAIRFTNIGENTTKFLNLFPANDFPHHCTDDGCVITASMKYTEKVEISPGTERYIMTDQNFDNEADSRPADFGELRYDYYSFNAGAYYTDTYCVYYNNHNKGNGDDYSGFSTSYESAVFIQGTTLVRKCTTEDPRKHMFQLLCAENGSVFGIYHTYIPNGSGVNRRFTEHCGVGVNPENDAYTTNTQWIYCPIGEYLTNANPNRPAGIHLTDTPTITEDSLYLPIFIGLTYQGVYYSGVAWLKMSSRTDTSQPVLMSAVLYAPEFWGDSLISGGQSGGNWGNDNVIAGGNGSFIASSDPHGDGTGADIGNLVVSLNTASGYFAAQGGINVYRLDGTGGNINGLTGILQILFSSDYFTKFLTSMYNPLSAVLSAHLLPKKLTTAAGTARHVTAGGFDVSDYMSGTPSAAVAKQFTQLHFAPIDIGHFSDSFADFAPYTSAKLHLPYCGVIDIDINKCMGGKLGVDYVCDAISGNVAAWVWVSDPKDANSRQYAYVATGNAAYSFPMFAETQSGAAVGKLIGAAGSAVVGALSGNPFTAAGAVSAGIDAILTGHNTKLSGTFSGNVGILTDPQCWLEITRPVWVQPSKYQQLKGITAQLSGTLADAGDDGHTPYSGFVIVSDIDLDTVEATDAELQEIERLLKSGVFIRAETE